LVLRKENKTSYFRFSIENNGDKEATIEVFTTTGQAKAP
jgi:hypothetical protein